MNEHTSTLLIVSLPPDKDEDARYHIDEMLTITGIAYTIIADHEERVTLEGTAPFILTYNEKRLVFALRAPLDSQTIHDLAGMVAIGSIFGFAVKGEIELGGEVGVINNLRG